MKAEAAALGIAIRLLLLSPPSSFFLGSQDHGGAPCTRTEESSSLSKHHQHILRKEVLKRYRIAPVELGLMAPRARSLSLSLISFLRVFCVLVCSGVYLLRVFQSLQSSDVRDNNIPLQPSFLRPLLAAPVVSTVSHFFSLDSALQGGLIRGE